MTREEIYAAARRQSAVDLGCAAEDFLRENNVVVLSRPDPGARRYLTLPFSCQLVTYGGNIVASVSPELREPVEAYLAGIPVRYCAFETPKLLELDEALRPFGQRVCFMAEYFLPEPDAPAPPGCPYELRLLYPGDFAPLYTAEWANALCEKRRELDMLAVGAYDEGGRLVGLAGCSADCEDMWQIGVDVLPGHRGRGLGPALTGRLTAEIFRRGKIPFYCAAWSNIRSVRTALRCGYRPAWLEVTARDSAFTESVLRGE